MATITVTETISVTYEVEVAQSAIDDFISGDDVETLQDAVLEQGVITYDPERTQSSDLLSQNIYQEVDGGIIEIY